MSGYDWTRDEFARLLLQKWIPERSDVESALIIDFLHAHLDEFDAIRFSVRVGQGATPAGDVLPQVRANFTRSTQKRIDVVGYQGRTVVLMEAKTHASHELLGQLLVDSHLWLEEHPDEPPPRLVAIARTLNEDAQRAFAANGIDLFVYPRLDTAAVPAPGGV